VCAIERTDLSGTWLTETEEECERNPVTFATFILLWKEKGENEGVR